MLEAHESGRGHEATERLNELNAASQDVLKCLQEFAEALDKELQHEEHRLNVRSKTDDMADVRTKDGVRRLRVLDASDTGLRLEGMSKSEIGQPMSVSYKGREYLAEGVWSDGQGGGVRIISRSAGEK